MSRPHHPAIPLVATTFRETQIRPTVTPDPPDVLDLVNRAERLGIRCSEGCPYDGVCQEGQCIIAEN